MDLEMSTPHIRGYRKTALMPTELYRYLPKLLKSFLVFFTKPQKIWTRIGFKRLVF